jgi:hypothetical protein
MLQAIKRELHIKKAHDYESQALYILKKGSLNERFAQDFVQGMDSMSIQVKAPSPQRRVGELE